MIRIAVLIGAILALTGCASSRVSEDPRSFANELLNTAFVRGDAQSAFQMIAEDQRTPSAMSNLQEMIRRFQDLCGIPISEALTGTAPRALD